MKIKELNSESRPRERLIKQGVNSLSDVEVLAILINTGTKNLSALDIANNLLNKYSLNELLNLDYESLASEYGIKESKASKIIASFELAKRAIKIKDKDIILDNPKKIYEYLSSYYLYKKEEEVLALLLTNKLKLIKLITLGKGDLNKVKIDTKILVKELIKYDTYGFILAHNHPSNDTNPSVSDKIVTTHICKLTKELNILLLDHVIWAHNSYFSFLENHLLEFVDID